MGFTYSEITSRKNEKIIWASKLSDKKNRDRENVFFVEGIKLFDEALKAGFNLLKLFFTDKALGQYFPTLSSASCNECFLVTDEVYGKLSCESAPQGIFAVFSKPHPTTFSDEKLSEGGFIILEDIQNPLNLGAIFRCAYSLGGTKLILSEGCADIYGPKTLRSGMGSIFKAEFQICPDICSFIKELRSRGQRVFCTHLHSDSLKLGTFSFLDSDSVVMGNEGHGVSADVAASCDSSVIIPMTKDAESLNAATASSVIIWEMNKSKLNTQINQE